MMNPPPRAKNNKLLGLPFFLLTLVSLLLGYDIFGDMEIKANYVKLRRFTSSRDVCQRD